MAIDPNLWAYLVFAALITIAPGADIILTTKNSILHGRRAGLVTATGIVSGLLVHATASALGLSLLLARSATAYRIVKYAGAAYLVYLGVRTLVDGYRQRSTRYAELGAVPDGARGSASSRPDRALWREGILSNVLNPKVALFYLTLLPQFIDPSRSVLAQSLALGTIHVVMGLVWLAMIAWSVDIFSAFLKRPAAQRGVSVASGGALVGLGVAVSRDVGT